jgi:predicted thioesterase
MPAVLSTPWLVNFLEKAGREALKPLLEDGENSVGMEIEVKHLAPTPVGQTVTCLARVIRVDDRVVDFQVEASDESELIARGFHKRAIIEMDRFARRVEKKRARQ